VAFKIMVFADQTNDTPLFDSLTGLPLIFQASRLQLPDSTSSPQIAEQNEVNLSPAFSITGNAANASVSNWAIAFQQRESEHSLSVQKTDLLDRNGQLQQLSVRQAAVQSEPLFPSVIRFYSGSFSASEIGSGTAKITLVREGNSTQISKVKLLAEPGTATAGADYDSTPIWVEFQAGQIRKTVTIPVLDDRLKEGQESVKLRLAEPTGATLGQQKTATLNLTDDEVITVAASRLANLERGLNLFDWFAGQYKAGNPDHFRQAVTAADLAFIKSSGFDHVRLPVNPSLLLNPNQPGQLNPQYLRYLDQALDAIAAQGLAVVVAMMPGDSLKRGLALDDAAVAQFAQFWQSLAGHLSTRDPEQTFLEILNEPATEYFFDNDLGQGKEAATKRWQTVQKTIVEAIRTRASEHTVIATSASWSEVDSLTRLTPLADPNIIYTLHFYEPMSLTHQGATWLDGFADVKLPYPLTEADRPNLVQQQLSEIAKQKATTYVEGDWNAAKIDQRIGKVANWAGKWGVPLWSGEFGAYAYGNLNPQARLDYIRDVRSAFEHHGIGWNMWEYNGGFGFARDNQSVFPGMVEALGLNGSASA
jgi:endoglucanase